MPTTKGYRPISLIELIPSQELSTTQEKCWYTILSGGAHCRPLELAEKGILKNTDLFYEARKITREYGMRVSRDWLEQALPSQDDSNGMMENRISATTNNPELIYGDSLVGLPREQKERIGIYFIPGFNFVGGMAGPMLKEGASQLVQMGFQSEVLPITTGDSAQVNSKIIRDQIHALAPHVDHIILACLSKGTNDVSYFLIHDMSSLPQEDQKKINVIVSLSGAARAIYMAQWMMETPGPTTDYFKNFVLNSMPPEERTMAGIESMAQDPWEGADYSALPGKDHLTWVNFSMIPPSPRGFLPDDDPFSFFTPFALAGKHDVGPYDGLVETGASVLPPNTGYREWIIRARGDHELVGSRYMDGTPVSSHYDAKDASKGLKAAGDVVDAFLRALPTSVFVSTQKL
jgi:hypothetical protein